MKRHKTSSSHRKHTALMAGSAIAALSLVGFSESANAAETPSIPMGSLDAAAAGVGSAQVSGWAIEPDTTGPINVQVFVDGVYNQTVSAATERDDVGAAFPGFGPMHGYTATISGLSATAHNIAVYAINNDGIQADNVLLATQSVTPLSSTSFGSVDVVAQATGDTVRVAGWAIDPKTSAPINVAVYVDGVATTNAAADLSRTDVGAAFPSFGANHGYDLTVPVASDGTHTIDVYALDSTGNGNGNNPLLARSTVGVNATPFGSVDMVAQATGDNVRVSGWAIDPKTSAPISVAVYVDGVATTNVMADELRPDVGAVFPTLGADHGYDVTVPVSADGTHTIDVYALDSTGNGNNPLLARETDNVSTAAFGSFDAAVQTTGDNVMVAGWAIDPKTSAPISVAVYVDGVIATDAVASASRPDVGAALPTYGASHGYFISVPIATLGSHTVDIYALDSTGNGNNPLLGRMGVVVTSSAIA